MFVINQISISSPVNQLIITYYFRQLLLDPVERGGDN